MKYPETPGFKGDADTGRNAAMAAARKAPDRRTEALNALAILREATAEQIAGLTGRHWYKTRPRLSELKALGRVQDTGKRALTGMGGKTIVWRLSTPDELALHLASKAAAAEHAFVNVRVSESEGQFCGLATLQFTSDFGQGAVVWPAIVMYGPASEPFPLQRTVSWDSDALFRVGVGAAVPAKVPTPPRSGSGGMVLAASSGAIH